mmetsp:Transcript_145454/g.253855  ORF Transcript_145454/g.253855 Transcript_145454/m.253855 type:complete len:255 (+) Transcript_145454:23-787(+)
MGSWSRVCRCCRRRASLMGYRASGSGSRPGRGAARPHSPFSPSGVAGPSAGGSPPPASSCIPSRPAASRSAATAASCRRSRTSSRGPGPIRTDRCVRGHGLAFGIFCRSAAAAWAKKSFSLNSGTTSGSCAAGTWGKDGSFCSCSCVGPIRRIWNLQRTATSSRALVASGVQCSKTTCVQVGVVMNGRSWSMMIVYCTPQSDTCCSNWAQTCCAICSSSCRCRSRSCSCCSRCRCRCSYCCLSCCSLFCMCSCC